MAPRKKVPLSVAPTAAAFILILTLVFITAFFYGPVTNECASDYHHHTPIDISVYTCCEPSKAIGMIGFILTALLLLAMAVPVFYLLRNRFEQTGYTAATAAVACIVLTSSGLLMLAFFNACEQHQSTVNAGNVFFGGSLLFCAIYNLWNLSHELPLLRQGLPDDDAAAVRLAFSSVVVGVLRLTLMLAIVGSTIFQFVNKTFEGWFINLWFISTCFLLQLLVVQFDFVVESRRSLMLSAAASEGAPLRSP